jgi:hypothetical protein
VALTANGNVQHSTAQQKFGASSIAFDGSGDYISAGDSVELGSGDFTIDCWVYLAGYSSSYSGNYRAALVAKHSSAASAFYLSIDGTSSSYTGLRFLISGGLNSTVSASFNLNQWYHVAVTRESGGIRFFVDGTQVGDTQTDATTIPNNSTIVRIGATGYTSFEYYLNGYLDELRITNTAEWTADFTPPTRAYNTYIVSGTITDDTGTPCARTVRLYDRATGAFIAETTSDAGTGAYDFSAVLSTDEVQRIVLDDSAGTLYNDLIDRVIPG